MTHLLSVENLRVELSTRHGVSPVIDDLSFTLDSSSTLSFVGESGCGKSMTALAIMGLLPDLIANITSGKILLEGEDLVTASPRRLSEIRGNDISMIFQEPMTSLNPLFTIGEQISEVLRRHQGLSRKSAWKQSIDWLDAVQIPSPIERATSYPHQLSGGQRQRVMIAMALACTPKILISDEPTTALDVTVQSQIFSLLSDLTKQTGTAQLLITHDMGIVSQMSKRMIVMYGGRKVEEGIVQDILSHPRHPYTSGLISCVPHLVTPLPEHQAPLTEIDGIVPPLSDFGKDACMFAPRCSHVQPECHTSRPPELSCSPSHFSSCFLAKEL